MKIAPGTDGELWPGTFADPGGNITGLSMVFTEIAAKELEILHGATPLATRIGVFWNPTTPTEASIAGDVWL